MAENEPVVTDPPVDPVKTPVTDPKADVTPIVTEPTSAKATIPAVSDPTLPADDTKYSFFETIPTEIKDKSYMKGVQNFEQLYKKLDGAQELLGKRPEGLPGEDATDEEKASFYKAMGKPDTAEAYEFVDTKLPEGVKRDEALTKFTKELFHKADLTSAQAKIIQGGYEEQMVKLAGEQKGDPALDDDAFDKLGTDLFKDRRDTVMKNGKLLIEENLDPSLKEKANGLSNEALMVLSSVLDGVRERYISEDQLPREGEVKGGAESVDDLRQQARVLMAKPEYTSKSHKDHQTVADEVAAIYDRIDRINARAK